MAENNKPTDSFAQFIAKHGLAYGALSMISGCGVFIIGNYFGLDGLRGGITGLGVFLFGYGAIVTGLTMLRWIVLRISWSDRVLGYTSKEAHDLLAAKDND